MPPESPAYGATGDRRPTDSAEIPPRVSRVFAALRDPHPAIGQPCAVCGVALAAGDQTALCLPGAPEGRNVPCQVAHATCTRAPDGGERL